LKNLEKQIFYKKITEKTIYFEKKINKFQQ